MYSCICDVVIVYLEHSLYGTLLSSVWTSIARMNGVVLPRRKSD